MRLVAKDNLEGVDAGQWDALGGAHHPFLSHAFLSALERTGCVGEGTGWTPHHLVLLDADRLLGAVPLYLKQHSYGEYVFDWAWASAYARAGLAYYPKLVAAVPFTPATGPRILLAPGTDRARLAPLLADGAREQARELAASSVHWLFTPSEETGLLEQRDYLRRTGYQFHWTNQGYASFEDFLAQLSAQKRKKIRRERRFVAEAGVELLALSGAALNEAHWETFYRFYRETTRKHGAIAYLNREFFQEVGRTMADRIVLILARHGGEYVAGALNFRGEDTLYGRYWGSTGEFHSLHFETCYYRAMEYCIEHGLARFEAGAQGEHKLSRGFLPAPVHSAHWLSHPQFNNAVADFLARERNGMEYYMSELSEHSPFRKACE